MVPKQQQLSSKIRRKPMFRKIDRFLLLNILERGCGGRVKAACKSIRAHRCLHLRLPQFSCPHGSTRMPQIFLKKFVQGGLEDGSFLCKCVSPRYD